MAVRIAAARNPDGLDTMATGRWAHYGVTAALGRLRGVSSATLVEAMAIAGVHGANQSASGYSRTMGSHTKEGIPWSALNGVLALDLAACGYTGPTDILDHPDYFDAPAILRDLGRGFALEGVYFKPYACCRWAHAALDALFAILAEEGVAPEAIERLEVRTFARALRLANVVDPQTLEAAQYSIPFLLGLGACRGREALAPLAVSSLGDAAAIALARRVELVLDPELDTAFPVRTAARLRLTAAGLRHERKVLHPSGDPANPLSRAALRAKFEAVGHGLATQALRDGLDAFFEGDARGLLAALAAPAHGGR